MAVRLLCIGDIHLGRRIRPGVSDAGVNLAELQPEAAWRRSVDTAINLGVDGVLLAGDVIDGDSHFFFGCQILHREIARLAEHGIPIVAVAGNHDVSVLPRLATEIPYLKLLGKNGTWESVTIASRRNPGEKVQIVGWSFPTPTFPASPLPALPALLAGIHRADGPLIGLLHCDITAGKASPHAPVSVSELASAELSAWLLGHIHVPASLQGPIPTGYLGSLIGLDPSETGWHGAWLLTYEPGTPIRLDRQSPAPLQWHNAELDVTGIDSPEAFEAAILGALRAAGETTAQVPEPPLVVGVRLSIAGSTALCAALPALTEKLLTAGDDRISVGTRPVCFLDDISLRNIKPEATLDLRATAQSVGPPAALAAMLLCLQEEPDSAEARAIIHEAGNSMRFAVDKRAYSRIPAPDLSEKAIRSHLLNAGFAALHLLLEQRATQSSEGKSQ
jgi:DNA repair protein SbcD/Mre11